MRGVIAATLTMAIWIIGLQTATAEKATQAVMQVQRARASISEFNRTHATATLDGALQSLESAGSQRLQGNDRETVLGGYFSLFDAIDRAMPHLPPGKLPAVSVLPPPVNGVRYPAGIDPSKIPDPAARERYEQAIRDNEAFTEQYLAAFSLQQIDSRAVMLFNDFAHDTFTRTDADQQTLQHLIRASKLTSSRKKQLLKAAVRRS